MQFSRYIGIDYSGAASPQSRLPGLQVYAASGDAPAVRLSPLRGRHWSRQEVAQFCAAAVSTAEPVIVGIDHAFSFPWTYMQRHAITTWAQFLDDFCQHWPTAEPGARVAELRARNSARVGQAAELRLCERWTAGPKSVFQFGMQGQVATSTHAGLPWIRWLRDRPDTRLHFWPFDGFNVPAGSCVIAEVYPSLFRRRYPRDARSADEQDAFAVAQWLADMDRVGGLQRYLQAPPLSAEQVRTVHVEGWILGVA